MKITIIGAGNVGTALAADLSLKGHQVCLFKSSTSMHNDNYDYIKKNKQLLLQRPQMNLKVEKYEKGFDILHNLLKII